MQEFAAIPNCPFLPISIDLLALIVPNTPINPDKVQASIKQFLIKNTVRSVLSFISKCIKRKWRM
jgi:hypothetical protein